MQCWLDGSCFGRIWQTRAVAGLPALQANTVYIGLPVLLTAYGPDGALPSIIGTFCLTFVFITGVSHRRDVSPPHTKSRPSATTCVNFQESS